jgi:hypothetical protein
MTITPKYRDIIDLIFRLPGFSGFQFNPREMVEVVNHLLHYDQPEILQILRICSQSWQAMADLDGTTNIDSTFSNARKRSNILITANALFIAKDDKVYPTEISAQQITPIEDGGNPFLSQTFPLCIYCGVPFLLSNGSMLFGVEKSPLDYVEWCQKSHQMRTSPLTPDANPLAVADEFLKSILHRSKLGSWQFHLQHMFKTQALRSVLNIYPSNDEETREILEHSSMEMTSRRWEAHKQAFSAMDVCWNQSINDYLPRRHPL